MPRTAESAFNPELAKVLRRKHPRWGDRIGVEQTNVLSEAAGLRPDLIVRHPGGVPVAVETEYTPAHTVEDDARQRLEKTLRATGEIIEQAIAVRIPDALASINQGDLEREIEAATLEFCMLSGDPETFDRWPVTGWLDGGVDDLANYIELAALSENRIARGMAVLESGIAQTANRLRDAYADTPDTLEAIAAKLYQKDGEQTTRMAMAIIANALTFHTAIAGTHGIKTLDELKNARGCLGKADVLDAWRYIFENINYWPIFKVASDVLLPIRNGLAQIILDSLARVAAELAELGATSQHDLSGRMFQRLITDRKFLATFYTLPSSAALLAELAVARLDVDWSSRDAVTGLKIGDFACGTGALLNAAYEAALSRYRRAGGDDRDIHPEMIEHTLVGSDIMPAASHLTASVLSSAHPSVTFGNTSILTLPYGEQPVGSGRRIAIGALDLIQDQESHSLFGTGGIRLHGGGEIETAYVDVPHGAFDLVIMNPPFTRSTGHEAEKIGIPAPAFAGFDTSENEQKHMSDRLKKMHDRFMAGHGNAGLASHFLDVAHAKVKSPEGVIALILPASFLQGEAWADSRRLLAERYKDVVIFTIAATGSTDRAFSADTGMAEVLVIATRCGAIGSADGSASFLNLLRRPESILEAKTVARAVQGLSGSRSVEPIEIGSAERAGFRIEGSLSETGPAGVRDASVAQTVTGLVQGELRLPRRTEAALISIVPLGELGDRGLYHMDISGTEMTGPDGKPRGPFDILPLPSGDIATYPALWNHNARRETRMVVVPDREGVPRDEDNERANETWEKTASRLHFNRDFRINSQPLAACLTPDLSIGGRAWPNFCCTDRRWEVPLVLWANTTLGLICFWWIGTRQQQGRAMLTISKLPALAVLDLRSLSDRQLDRADEIFEHCRGRALLPANEAWRDEARQALDEAVLVNLLELPEDIMEPLHLLRRQWCAEPSVHGGKSTAPVE